jgi:hypothetical protein
MSNMNLTEYFYSLPQIDHDCNKYTSFSLAFNNPYRLATGVDAFRYDKFDLYLKKFIADQGKCVAMPNIVCGIVTAIMFRSCSNKQFRYYNESPYIPYGAGINEKPYYKPWVIVESVLDSDFLRNFYPFVIATNGTTVSNNLMKFLQGTCSTLYCGFDSDNSGEDAFHRLCMKYSGSDKCFHIKRLKPPMSLNGNYLKDFGEVLDCLYNHNIDDYDYYVLMIKNYFLNLQ